jgi:hypothetical protein
MMNDRSVHLRGPAPRDQLELLLRKLVDDRGDLDDVRLGFGRVVASEREAHNLQL